MVGRQWGRSKFDIKKNWEFKNFGKIILPEKLKLVSLEAFSGTKFKFIQIMNPGSKV